MAECMESEEVSKVGLTTGVGPPVLKGSNTGMEIVLGSANGTNGRKGFISRDESEVPVIIDGIDLGRDAEKSRG
jgi:hypothetical protein